MIEPGESPSQAVIREVREETGLAVEVERVLGVLVERDLVLLIQTETKLNTP